MSENADVVRALSIRRQASEVPAFVNICNDKIAAADGASGGFVQPASPRPVTNMTTRGRFVARRCGGEDVSHAARTRGASAHIRLEGFND